MYLQKRKRENTKLGMDFNGTTKQSIKRDKRDRKEKNRRHHLEKPPPNNKKKSLK